MFSVRPSGASICQPNRFENAAKKMLAPNRTMIVLPTGGGVAKVVTHAPI